MATLNLQVGAANQDAFQSAGAGTMYHTISVATTLGNFYFPAHVGLYFSGVSGLSGATITAATLTLRASATNSDDFTGDWYAHKAAAPGVFTSTASNISDEAQRPRTTATCEGDSVDFGAWTSGQDHTFTGDGVNTIVDILQELANSHDPSAIVLVWIYGSGNGQRLASSYDLAAGTAPKLDITYTVAAGDATLTAVLATATALAGAATFTADGKIEAPPKLLSAFAYARGMPAEMTATSSGTLLAGQATATALSLASTWDADAKLEPPVATAYASAHAATLLAVAVGWRSFDETQFQITREDFPSSAVFYLEAVMTTNSALNIFKGRLYNVTDSIKVTGAQVSGVATSAEPTLSGSFDFPPGTKTYRFEGGGDAGGFYTWNIVRVLVDW